MNKKKIVCVGAALVDILLQESEDFLKQTGSSKGGMHFSDEKKIEKYIAASSGKPTIVPGGSGCNTAIGIGRLGGNALFVGKSGNDEFGRLFESGLKKNNVTPFLIKSDMPTGRVLSIVTPDAERTMFTFLGASETITSESIKNSFFENAALVHLEGYLLFNPEIMMTSLEKAKKAGALISIDIASYTIVEKSKELLAEIIVDYADILIANEDEAKAYTGIYDESEAVAKLSQGVDIAVIKVGKLGSYIASDNKIFKIEPAGYSEKVIDTTGAGDLWASGFLFGLVQGWDIEKCGQLGSLCGYEVCKILGAHIPDERWNYIGEFYL